MIQLSEENKQVLMDEIKDFFMKERDEELSDFQAENYLSFVLNTAGVYIYNQAISDAHTFMTEKVDELFVMERQVMSGGKGNEKKIIKKADKARPF